MAGSESLEFAIVSARHDQKQVWSRLPAGFAASSFIFFYVGVAAGAIWLAALCVVELSGYCLKHHFIGGAHRLRHAILLNVFAVSLCWITHAALCWATGDVIAQIATVMDLFTVSLYAVMGSFQDRRIMLMMLAPALCALSILLISYLWTHAPPLMALFATVSTLGACQLIVMNGLALSNQHRKAVAATNLLLASEQNFRLAAKAAEAANIAKSEFLANISHELRTPLTSIIGFGDLLHEDETLGGRARLFSQRVRDGGRALLAIINDVLDFTEIERDKIVISPRPCWIGDVAGEVLALLEFEAEAKDLPIALRCESELFVSRYLVDDKRLRQLLLNLLGNALKFSDSGKIAVSLSLRSADRLRCEVSDEGPGISDEDQRSLFQRFSRLGNSSAKEKAGTGLGLAICEGIVRAWQGEIGVRSTLGAGSTFWFELPISKGRDPGEPPVPVGPHGMFTGKRVLVADDSETTLQFVSIALNAMGIQCTQARSGEEAVALARLERFDLILMDVRMPGMGGTQAMKTIRQEQGGAHLVIVAFTGDGDLGGNSRLLDQGFSSVLTKPVTVEGLRNFVAENNDQRQMV